MLDTGALLSISAGAITALVAVFLTVFLRNQWEKLQTLRAMQIELELNTDQLRDLAELLSDDLQRQQVDMPIEVPPGTNLEIRYVVSFPGGLSTTAFERLKHSGMFLRLPTEVQHSLFELYDAIDRINRLRRHRERIHFEDVGNVHIIIDPDDLDIEPATTITEDDLSPELRQRLSDLRRMRRAMNGVNRSILRLIVLDLPGGDGRRTRIAILHRGEPDARYRRELGSNTRSGYRRDTRSPSRYRKAVDLGEITVDRHDRPVAGNEPIHDGCIEWARESQRRCSTATWYRLDPNNLST